MYQDQVRVSEELKRAGFKYVRHASHPNIFLPVALHECDAKTYILVENNGALSVVNRDDLSYASRMPQRAVDFFLKKIQ